MIILFSGVLFGHQPAYMILNIACFIIQYISQLHSVW